MQQVRSSSSRSVPSRAGRWTGARTAPAAEGRRQHSDAEGARPRPTRRGTGDDRQALAAARQGAPYLWRPPPSRAPVARDRGLADDDLAHPRRVHRRVPRPARGVAGDAREAAVPAQPRRASLRRLPPRRTRPGGDLGLADDGTARVPLRGDAGLRQVLARAVVWRLLDVNPAKQGIENPQRRRTEKRPFESSDASTRSGFSRISTPLRWTFVDARWTLRSEHAAE